MRDLVLGVCLLLSFVNFAVSIRCAVFVGFVLTSGVSAPAAMLPAVNRSGGGGGGRGGGGGEADGDIEMASSSARRAGGVVALALNTQDAVRALAACESHFTQMTVHFSLGIRAFYLAVPVVLYSGGPIVFLVSSCLVFAGLLYIDANGIS